MGIEYHPCAVTDSVEGKEMTGREYDGGNYVKWKDLVEGECDGREVRW